MEGGGAEQRDPDVSPYRPGWTEYGRTYVWMCMRFTRSGQPPPLLTSFCDSSVRFVSAVEKLIAGTRATQECL